MGRRKLTEEEKAIRKAKMKWNESVNSHKRIIEGSLAECKETIKRPEFREPTYLFNVGDRVEWGNWEWVHILEVCENGKYYKILRMTSQKKQGHRSFEIKYLLWPDLRPYRTKEEKEINPRLEEEDDIHIQYGQRMVDSILMSYYNDHLGIDMNPDYQRELVWTEKQKVSLIDSIFKNVDIGKFTFIEIPYKEGCPYSLEVLDGKQRIQALVDFYECRFKYKGLTFNELHWRDQNHFEGYNISWASTEPLTNEQKYRYFLKLNISGVPMDKKHIDKVFKMWQDETKRLKKG